MSNDAVIVRGARVHNLQDIDVRIPRNAVTVVTGLSGSGKSSLAFDTIYAEGQRRYVESLSAYARQFLGLMEKPDVDAIEGLSPAISIEQKTGAHNPRSTVGTVTEIYDYLRLLWARVGVPHCPNDGSPIERQSPSQIADIVLGWPRDTKIEVIAPLVRGRKGEFKDLFEGAQRQGFVRVLVDGDVHDLARPPKLNRRVNHDIGLIVDRLIVREEDRRRLTDSLETALRASDGLVEVKRYDGGKTAGAGGRKRVGEGGSGRERAARKNAATSATKRAVRGGKGREGAVQADLLDSAASAQPETVLFAERFACAKCGYSLPELEPRQFSFNSPYGACLACGGLGTRRVVAADLVLGDPRISLLEGVVLPWGEPKGYLRNKVLPTLAQELKFDLKAPWGKIPKRAQKALLEGIPNKTFTFRTGSTRNAEYEAPWDGILTSIERRYQESSSDAVREQLSEYMVIQPCGDCGGHRLKAESLSVLVAGQNIGEVVDMSVSGALEFFRNVPLRSNGKRGVDSQIAGPILKEVVDRLGFLCNVGLDYLTLGRAAASLSGGEAQRIRLATQVGSRLVGVLYVLDEPSIGLHPRDNARLLETLRGLRELGNTVLIVEHDEETIRTADHIIDLGPRAGRDGGRVVVEGPLDDVLKHRASLTGRYMRGELRIPVPSSRRPDGKRAVEVVGATQHNLKKIDVRFPLGMFVAITGVSGSGKSTLVTDILYRALARALYGAKILPGNHKTIRGVGQIDKVLDIDQSPIGRTPRSNPATYTGLFTPIRELYAQLGESKIRGYGPGRFSFNVKGGRCESCQGDGLVKIEMHFLPDVYVRCDLCKGKRYNRETLEVRYRGRSIADVLEMTVADALEFFEHQPRIRQRLELLNDVGLGYVHLGQSATTLSGGEAQRVKLATELSKRDTGRTFYILDEPTTGLHFEDVRLLLEVLHRLVDKGNTVVVIEHNMEVVKTADWVIDLGPEGGDAGGEVVASGPPEKVAKSKRSYTGRFLKRALGDGKAG